LKMVPESTNLMGEIITRIFRSISIQRLHFSLIQLIFGCD
jgi:hypothetical protein